LIAGLEELTSGTVEWSTGNGVARPHTGVVFQQPLLMPWLNRGGKTWCSQDDSLPTASRFQLEYAQELLRRFDFGAGG